jgi:preprotein translocase subunit SecE
LSVVRFIRGVRTEVLKVVWPSRKETVSVTVIVFVFVAIASGFFFLVDSILAFFANVVLGR